MILNPLKRRDHLYLITPLQTNETIPIELECSPEEFFNAWLDLLPDQRCQLHPNSTLKPDRQVSLQRFKDGVGGPLATWPASMVRSIKRGKMDRNLDLRGFYQRCRACKLLYAGVPPEFHERSFEQVELVNEEITQALARCRGFVEQVDLHGAGFVVMCGMPGNGKTMLAANMLGATRFWNNLYVTQTQLSMHHRQERQERHRPPEGGNRYRNAGTFLDTSIWGVAADAELLAIDEIGCIALPNDELMMMDELLKHRYDHRNATILVSNLPLAGTSGRSGLREFLGDALSDRIHRASGQGRFAMQFSSPSFRRSAQTDYLSYKSS